MTVLWIQDNDFTACGEALVRLLEGGQTLEAYQIAFDVNEMAGQAFSEGVIQVLEGAGKGVQEELTEEEVSFMGLECDCAYGNRRRSRWPFYTRF